MKVSLSKTRTCSSHVEGSTPSGTMYGKARSHVGFWVLSFTLECRSEASSFVSNSEPAGPTRQMQYGSDVPASQVSVLRSPCALCTRIEPVEPTFTLSSSTFCGILTSGGDGDGDNSGDGDGDGDNSGDGDGELAPQPIPAAWTVLVTVTIS